MKDVFIDHLCYSLGEEMNSVEDAAAKGRTRSSASVLREAGFQKHHVSRSGTTSYTLAKNAVLQIQERLEEIDLIIYSTCVPINGSVGSEEAFRETRDVKHLMDFPASHLQSDFKLERAVVVGLSQQACTGMLGSLTLARMFLSCEPTAQRVLCVTADRFPDGALYEQSYNLISDGAAACIVSTEPQGFRVVVGHGVTNGAMAQASDDETVGSYFNYAYRVIQETLAKAHLQMKDIRWLVPQNMNVKAWQILARLLQMDFEHVYFRTIGEVAHVISGDNIVNLKQLAESGQVQPGERSSFLWQDTG